MRLGLAACAALALSACAPAASGPEQVVQKLYAPYLSHAAEHGQDGWDTSPFYSKAFRAEIDRGLTYSTLLDQPVIDFDPVADGQDFSLSRLKLTLDQPPTGGKAHVTARFDNAGAPTIVGYDLVFEDKAWRIDAIKDGQDDLRKLIEDGLKPIGEPAAMTAPIAALYARYAAGPAPAPPLASWAPLSPDLRAALADAQSRNKGALGFDPVLGGNAGPVSAARFEVAGAAVIARFNVGAEERIVAYDLVENENGWRIADIRGPLASPPWDLVLTVQR